MSILSDLGKLVGDEFKAVLPVVNTIVSDMIANDATWNASPIVKSTEAVAALVSPVAAIDAQAVIGAASLVQALWQTFGGTNGSSTAQSPVTPALSAALEGKSTHPEDQVVVPAGIIPAGAGVTTDLHSGIDPTAPAIPVVPPTALEESHM